MKHFTSFLSYLSEMHREWIGNASGLTRPSRGNLCRIAAMITLLLTLACGNVWGATATLSVIGTDYTLVNQSGTSVNSWTVNSSGMTKTGTSALSYSNVTQIVVTFSSLGSSNAGKFMMET